MPAPAKLMKANQLGERGAGAKRKLKAAKAERKSEQDALGVNAAAGGRVKKAGARQALKAGLKKKGKRLLAEAAAQPPQAQPKSVAMATNQAAEEKPALTEKLANKLANKKAKKQANKQAKKAKKRAAEEEKPPVSASSSSTVAPEAPNKSNKAPKDFLIDTDRVQDPLLRADIQACIERRVRSTVRVRPLPNRLRLKQIAGLSEEALAARVPWNYTRGTNKGVAFLEFASPEEAERQARSLDGNKSLGCRLNASVRDDLQLVDIDDYNCSRVVVSSLHPFTTAQELKEAEPRALKVDFLCGSKSLRKHAPAVAFLTFANERQALEAIGAHQGEIIRNRKTSWMFQKRAERPEEKYDRAELVVFGVSKRVTDGCLLKAFPNCQNLQVREQSGMAIISYANETDCRADYDACKGGVAQIGKAKLHVFFGHSNYKPVELRRKEAEERRRREAEANGEGEGEKPPPQKRQKAAAAGGKPKFDASLLNKTQLVVKDFHPSVEDSSFGEFVDGVRRVFLTPNRRLAFLHFGTEAEAEAAKEKLATQQFHGARLKVTYAMDKPEKKAANREKQLDKKEGKQVGKVFGNKEANEAGKKFVNKGQSGKAAGKVGVKKSKKPPSASAS